MNNDIRLSQSRLGEYAKCPRKYEFKREWGVETPDETLRYRRRGIALHGAIEDTWLEIHPSVQAAAIDENDPNPIVEPMGELPIASDEVKQIALKAFDRRWAEQVPADAYQTDAHREFDRRSSRLAIAEYFGDDGPGRYHLKHAISSEATVKFTARGLDFQGLLDLVCYDDDKLHIIDYKSSLKRIISDHRYYGPKAIEDHQQEDAHKPDEIKSLMQAVLYTRAAREFDLYEEGMTVQFTFYGLRDDVDVVPSSDGKMPDVTASKREMTDFIEEYEEEAWEFIETYSAGIRERDYDPEPWELIHEKVCPECPYQEMCPDFIESEVVTLE